MASTNKTKHLELCQWVSSDPVLMEDFNEDNQKIDAAIKEAKETADQAIGDNHYVRIMDITTTAEVNTVSMDLSGIDMTAYSELRICQDSGYTRDYLLFRINKLSGTSDYQYLTTTDSAWASTYYTFLFAYGAKTTLHLQGTSIIMHALTGLNTAVYGPTYLQRVPTVNGAQLESIDFLWGNNNNISINENALIPVGTQFILEGVEK